jgi:hypothetical protein
MVVNDDDEEDINVTLMWCIEKYFKMYKDI